MGRPKIVLVGGGPSCLIAACFLADHFNVEIYEKGKAIGRKFLVAGKGGFNLTNSSVDSDLIAAYSNHPNLHNSLASFDSNATRDWLKSLGIETFVGSSGRVFPVKGIKPATVLKSIRDFLAVKGVVVNLNAEFVGFSSNNKPLIKKDKTTSEINANHYIFGLGGGSWKKTGANDKWLKCFQNLQVKTSNFEASNCGVSVDFESNIFQNYAGMPLKNIQITCDNYSLKGEAVITDNGLEGNVIYPLIPSIRNQFALKNTAEFYIDFKPNNSLQDLRDKYKNQSLKPKNYCFAFNIEKGVLQLIKNRLSKEAYFNPDNIVLNLKNFKVNVLGLRPVEEAISTVGGIDMNELSVDFSLNNYPNISVIGEMLDWDAPTGGFLLQGCFSTGYQAAMACIKNYSNE